MAERLQKIISQWGLASRRKAECWIMAGRVRLNGVVATLGDKADPASDCVEVDGKRLRKDDRPHLIYLLLNKPKGILSTCRDERARKTVLDVLPSKFTQDTGLHPVGRLDRNSSGALLLTNDGDLTQALTHPAYHLPKVYRVWVRGKVSSALLRRWQQGVELDGERTQPAEVDKLLTENGKTLLEIVLTEGKNRQIRRTAEQLGLEVVKLHRIAIGNLELTQGNGRPLASGSHRPLSQREIKDLKHSAVRH
ncbi:MAG: pseudouridine synthase [Cyanobacteria bacterium P01_H01_bin.15]